MADDPLAAALAKKREALAAAWAVLERTPPRTLAPSLGIAAGVASVALDAVDEAVKLHAAEPWYLAASDCEHPEPPEEDSEAHDDWYDDHTPGSSGIVIRFVAVAPGRSTQLLPKPRVVPLAWTCNPQPV